MKRHFIISLLAMALLAPLGAGQTGARQIGRDQAGKDQPASVTTTAPGDTVATLRRDVKDSFPIPPGEKLEYEVKITRFPLPRPVSLGVRTCEHLGAVSTRHTADTTPGDQPKAPTPMTQGLNTEFAPAPDEQLWRLRATAVSKGMFVAMVGFDAIYRYETLVDLRDFSARANVKEVKEGKKHFVQSSLFDRAEQQVKYLTTDLTKPDAPPRAKPMPRQDGMLSLLSAIYFVRLQKLNEGQMLTFPVSSDEENYQFEVLVGKRESIKTECGKVRTVRLEPKLFGPGRFFSKLEGEITMWVSDDNKRRPLRLLAKTPKGTVTAKLLNFKKKCHIIDQDDEGKQKND